MKNKVRVDEGMMETNLKQYSFIQGTLKIQ